MELGVPAQATKASNTEQQGQFCKGGWKKQAGDHVHGLYLTAVFEEIEHKVLGEEIKLLEVWSIKENPHGMYSLIGLFYTQVKEVSSSGVKQTLVLIFLQLSVKEVLVMVVNDAYILPLDYQGMPLVCSLYKITASDEIYLFPAE